MLVLCMNVLDGDFFETRPGQFGDKRRIEAEPSAFFFRFFLGECRIDIFLITAGLRHRGHLLVAYKEMIVKFYSNLSQ